MNKIFKFLFACFCFFTFILPVGAEDKITIYFFHGKECPHCALEGEFLEDIEKEYSNVEVKKYEVWYDVENAELLTKVKKHLDVTAGGVPFTVIGTSSFLGYNDATGDTLKRAINYYQENEYVDVVSKIISGEISTDYVLESDEFSKEEAKSDSNLTVDFFSFGKVNLKKVSISSAAIIIGLIDGFNPCAMWVLLFLISMLIGMKDKKRMWIYGVVFLVTSALVYVGIMFSWINIVVKITTSIIIRNIIAILAICGAVFNFYSFMKSKKSGCVVVSDKKRKKIFERIKKFTREESFILGLLGIIGLAVSVNVVELACSAGLPLVFTQLLAINDITGISALLYIFLYILFFLVDDLFVFFVAMFTMKITGISTKFGKYSHLVGAILMFIIGTLLLFKPEWLMFQFK